MVSVYGVVGRVLTVMPLLILTGVTVAQGRRERAAKATTEAGAKRGAVPRAGLLPRPLCATIRYIARHDAS